MTEAIHLDIIHIFWSVALQKLGKIWPKWLNLTLQIEICKPSYTQLYLSILESKVGNNALFFTQRVLHWGIQIWFRMLCNSTLHCGRSDWGHTGMTPPSVDVQPQQQYFVLRLQMTQPPDPAGKGNGLSWCDSPGLTGVAFSSCTNHKTFHTHHGIAYHTHSFLSVRLGSFVVPATPFCPSSDELQPSFPDFWLYINTWRGHSRVSSVGAPRMQRWVAQHAKSDLNISLHHRYHSPIKNSKVKFWHFLQKCYHTSIKNSKRFIF